MILIIFFQTNLNKFYIAFRVSRIIIQKIMEILFINYFFHFQIILMFFYIKNKNFLLRLFIGFKDIILKIKL